MSSSGQIDRNLSRGVAALADPGGCWPRPARTVSGAFHCRVAVQSQRVSASSGQRRWLAPVVPECAAVIFGDFNFFLSFTGYSGFLRLFTMRGRHPNDQMQGSAIHSWSDFSRPVPLRCCHLFRDRPLRQILAYHCDDCRRLAGASWAATAAATALPAMPA